MIFRRYSLHTPEVLSAPSLRSPFLLKYPEETLPHIYHDLENLDIDPDDADDTDDTDAPFNSAGVQEWDWSDGNVCLTGLLLSLVV